MRQIAYQLAHDFCWFGVDRRVLGWTNRPYLGHYAPLWVLCALFKEYSRIFERTKITKQLRYNML
jgi:hypothetical protein